MYSFHRLNVSFSKARSRGQLETGSTLSNQFHLLEWSESTEGVVFTKWGRDTAFDQWLAYVNRKLELNDEAIHYYVKAAVNDIRSATKESVLSLIHI